MICPHDPESEAYALWMEMLDADIDGEIERELIYCDAMTLIEKGLWIQKDGKVIPIKEMTGSHIRNTIAMIDRNFSHYDDLTAEVANAWRAAMKKELARRYPPRDPAFIFD